MHSGKLIDDLFAAVERAQDEWLAGADRQPAEPPAPQQAHVRGFPRKNSEPEKLP
jgi:hypothetical protein